jgi:hypothetical protein
MGSYTSGSKAVGEIYKFIRQKAYKRPVDRRKVSIHGKFLNERERKNSEAAEVVSAHSPQGWRAS